MDEEIYVPVPEDEDPEANEKMHQGKEGFELYDPWFNDAKHALTWKKED